MKISDRQPKISDSLKISDFSNSLGCCSTPKHPQQYAYVGGWYKQCVVVDKSLICWLNADT